MTGPPTPPLITPAEIEDEARTSEPTQPEQPPTPAPTEALQTDQPPANEPAPATVVEDQRTQYEIHFRKVAELAEKSEYQELINFAEEVDIIPGNEKHPTRVFITAPLVLSYCIVDQLPAARHALTRLPKSLASLPVTKGLYRLLASVWERNYSSVYIRAKELFNLCQQTDPASGELPTLIANMVTVFVDAFRAKTFALLAKAYTSLPVSLAHTYLGYSPEELLTVATSKGWICHNQSLIPPPPSTSRSDNFAARTPLYFVYYI
ncbi:uncharacterized protein FIBRA_05764 [Fibroporia radiculosa]|uniref:CSN8/PSMD8/EIF3K domain-containing protein n=1 Tax=Fibroporia radiculosa TaxID=599839 RepID=J4GRK0_9APHY|nr:uncharacterized protein FIBRA_05764 [Fibroporia radiculosa]CCM03620.1 predicted protein [Fibroporia radiculosa]